MDNHWVPEFAALGYLQTVDHMITNDRQTEIHTDMINQMKWSGYVWGIPKDMNPHVLAVNREVLLQQGILELPKSADDWMHVIRETHNPDEGKIGLYMEPGNPNALVSLMWTVGGTWLDLEVTEELPVTHLSAERLQQLLFKETADEEAEEAADSLNSLTETIPYPSEVFNPWEKIKSGEIAFYLTDLAAYQNQSPAASSLEIINLPNLIDTTNSAAPNLLQGRSFVITSNSEVADEASEWILAMTSEERQIEMMDKSGWLPVNMNSYFIEPLISDANHKVITNAVLQGRVLSFDPKLTQKLGALKGLQTQLWNGEITVPQFIEELQTFWHLS
jgi:maltose-binding protein MalE